MKYDFTTIIDRKGKDAISVDNLGNGSSPGAPKEGFDAIPMWIADMNFATAPSVKEAIIERAMHPLYGYYVERPEYFESIINWHSKRYGTVGLTKENIGYENGVLGGVISALNIFCSKGDKVLINSPTYIGFTWALTKNGYNMVHSPMYKDENDIWRLDFEDMEKKIVDNQIHACVFCSPHNPCGRVWERWELEKLMDIFERHDVKIVSDEIWADIILGDNKHIPTQMVNEYARKNTVAMYAPSKTFNLAGLVGSYHVVYDKWLADRMEKESTVSSYNEMNVLSMHALIGAYSKGEEWVNELLSVLKGNVDYAVDYIRKNFEGVTVSKPQGTYMLFVDCEEWCKAHNMNMDELERALWDVGCAVQDGRRFHGEWCFRMNVASPLSRIKEALDRMDKYVFNKQG